MSRWVGIAGSLAVLLLVAGCGGPKGPPRYRLHGKVTYQGQPVPEGEIQFMPDSAKGNSGPGSFAVIHNGEYETTDGQGTVGGPHFVRITGYSEPPAGEGSTGATEPMFPTFREAVDLPREDAEKDFEVPVKK